MAWLSNILPRPRKRRYRDTRVLRIRRIHYYYYIMYTYFVSKFRMQIAVFWLNKRDIRHLIYVLYRSVEKGAVHVTRYACFEFKLE